MFVPSRNSLFLCAAIALVATPVLAQPGGGRGGRGGGPGGGGIGNSKYLPVAAALRSEEVREEIGLEAEQVEALKKMNDRENGRRGGERPDFRNMSEEERGEFMAKMQKEREAQMEESNAMVEQILLPPQLDRLREIAIQMTGVNALFTDYVTTELKITDAQKSKLTEAQTASQAKMREKMQEMFAGRGRGGDDQAGERPDREAMRAQFEEVRKSVETDLLAVLSSEQQAEFEKLKGVKFDLPERAFGGRGGEAGGRGDRGGRGGEGGGQRRGGRQRPESSNE
ncbi:hypothetical protein Poly24_15160 [Rosistilla carotiformis]|uniref:Periplasmic repressor CpxP n=1 Tax=Rosistilla carotiformis TaxID=2528017 RepID=A0A518JQK0_9BACT|nr:Spy/CpxP family protein refolding chaperone [Rosistilla carotiformis]QDV67812.1 hypothetical protein Poly24_15160 [Rosistilla carotiformis]